VVEFFQHILQTTRVCREALSGERRKKRIQRGPTKRESGRFHSTWVKETMPAAEGMAGQVDEVPVAVEVMAGMLWQLCLARHLNKGHANTSKAISSL
jgi:hypothetical protein